MTRKRKSTTSETSLVGLRHSHEQRRNSSVEKVKQAIQKLQMMGNPVTLGRIAKASHEFSIDGVGISESTILHNLDCRKLYEEAAQPVRRRRKVKRTLVYSNALEPTPAEMRRLYYLLRMTKTEMGSQIIMLEREVTRLEQANNVLRDKLLSTILDPPIKD